LVKRNGLRDKKPPPNEKNHPKKPRTWDPKFKITEHCRKLDQELVPVPVAAQKTH